MSNISNKISSIEPEDDTAAKGLGLRPSGDNTVDTPKSSVTQPDEYTTRASINQDPVPEFITRNAPDGSYVKQSKPGWVLGFTVGLALLWLALSAVVAVVFFDVGSTPNALSTLKLVGLTLLALIPLVLICLLGVALGRLSSISNESAQLRQTAERLMSPDDTAVSRASLMAQNITIELDQVNQKVDAALSRTAKLKDTLETHVTAINQATHLTENKTKIIAERLKEERDALVSISTTYDDRMSALSKMLDTHSADLARSTQEAEQKIQEARISVEGVASKINVASEVVRENTVEAASNLEANQKEISRLGNDLKARAEELDGVYRKHTNDLATMISDLKTEQETLGATLEARLQKMRDMSLSAQVSAEHLTEASEAGRHTVEALAGAARLADSAVKKRFTEMEEMVRYSNTRAEKISETAARRVQESLAQTRKEISRIEYDMVALQDRLKKAPVDDQSQDIEHLEVEAEDITPTPKPAQKKRRGILGLRPAIDDQVETEDTPEPETPPVRLRGLRPATSTQIELEQEVDTPRDELSIPPLDIEASVDTPTGKAPETLTEPEVSSLAEEERDPNTLELEFEIPQASDLLKPDPDEDLKTFDPDLLRRAVPDDRPRTKPVQQENEKSSWWKGLFGGGKKEEETFAIDQLTAPPSTEDKLDLNPQTPDIISALTALGLTPSAIVDDGCIIEAVNARVSKGPLAMSDVIMHRLDDPVRHLYQSSEADPNLKDILIAFARDFHTSLGPIEDNREAIRTRLESDEGRAFLLCDAALNL